MRSPQLENGYLKIANELLEAIMLARFNARERWIIDVVIRFTYGYNKKEASIDRAIFQDYTGLDKRAFFLVRQSLINQKVIIHNKGVYQLNKNYNDWSLPGVKRIPGRGLKESPVGGQKNPRSGVKRITPLLYKDNINTTLKTTIKTTGASPHSAECLLIMKEVYEKGLNIYQLENRLKKEMKPISGFFPDQVIEGVCKDFLKSQERISSPWAWFVKTFKMQSADYFAKQNQKEHEKYKKEPMAIGNIMQAIAQHSSGAQNEM